MNPNFLFPVILWNKKKQHLKIKRKSLSDQTPTLKTETSISIQTLSGVHLFGSPEKWAHVSRSQSEFFWPIFLTAALPRLGWSCAAPLRVFTYLSSCRWKRSRRLLPAGSDMSANWPSSPLGPNTKTMALGCVIALRTAEGRFNHFTGTKQPWLRTTGETNLVLGACYSRIIIESIPRVHFQSSRNWFCKKKKPRTTAGV